MIKSTLVYIQYEDSYLMLFRGSKKNDPNEGKWIGIGGKFEEGETAEECLLREVHEEVGITLTDYTQRGLIEFRSDTAPDEDMYLYTARYSGAIENLLVSCNEGTLALIKKEEVLSLPLWEGDRFFLEPLIYKEETASTFIRLRLEYSGNSLVKVTDLSATPS